MTDFVGLDPTHVITIGPRNTVVTQRDDRAWPRLPRDSSNAGGRVPSARSLAPDQRLDRGIGLMAPWEKSEKGLRLEVDRDAVHVA